MITAVVGLRHDDEVGQDVIDVIGAHRSRIAEVIDLNRRRAPGEDAGARHRREAHQVDQDIDFQFGYQAGDPLGVVGRDVDEALESSLQAFADVRFVVRPERDGNGFETRAVVALEDAGHEIGHRLFAKVGGHVGQADAIVIEPRPLPNLLGGRRELIGDPQPGALQLVVGRRRGGEKREGRRVRLSALDGQVQMRAFGVVRGPIAEMHFGVEADAFHAGQIGGERKGFVVGGKGVIVSLEPEKDIAAAEPGLGAVRLEGDRLVVGSKGVVVALELVEDIAAAEPGVGEVGLQRKRALVSGGGDFVAPERVEDVAAAEPGPGEIGLQRQRLVVSGECVVMPFAFGQDIAAAEPCFRQIGLAGASFVIRGRRNVVALEREENVAAAKPCFRHVRLERQRLVVGGKSFVVTGEPEQAVAEITPRLHVLRFEGERLPIAGDRFFVTAQFFERLAAIVQSRGVVRHDLQQPVENGQRFGEPLEQQQRCALILQRAQMRAIDRDRLLIAKQCVLMPAQSGQHVALVGENVGVARVYFQGALEEPQRLRGMRLQRFDHTGQMQGDDIAFVFVDNDRAQPARFEHVAGAKRGDGLREQRSDGARIFRHRFVSARPRRAAVARTINEASQSRLPRAAETAACAE